MEIDHLGIAVASLATAVPAWTATTGTIASPEEEVPAQSVRVVFFPTPGGHLELLEPTRPDSAVGRFLAQRGPGLHHVAFAVPDVDAALAAVERRGGRLIDRTGRPGARGRTVGFAHPSAHAGVLVEFVEGP